MATLYKRATPAQYKLLRVVEGAVLNTFDAHGLPREPVMARSIAKRAAGTLSACWPEVLAAASLPSERSGLQLVQPSARSAQVSLPIDAAHLAKRRSVGPLSDSAATRRGASKLSRRSPLTRLWRQLSVQMRDIHRSGNVERYKAYQDVLKAIAELQRDV